MAIYGPSSFGSFCAESILIYERFMIRGLITFRSFRRYGYGENDYKGLVVEITSGNDF